MHPEDILFYYRSQDDDSGVVMKRSHLMGLRNAAAVDLKVQLIDDEVNSSIVVKAVDEIFQPLAIVVVLLNIP